MMSWMTMMPPRLTVPIPAPAMAHGAPTHDKTLMNRMPEALPSPVPGDARAELRAEIAATAASLIADSALDYQSAKQKAARRVFGGNAPPAGLMPGNDEIDQALREHLDLFDPDHAERVAAYRQAALLWLSRLADHRPHVCGGAWKGIVAPHTPLHIQCFTDDGKELEMLLLDAGVHYDVVEVAHFSGRQPDVPALVFHDRHDLPIMISIYQHDDLRGALKRTSGHTTERGDLAALERLIGSAGNDTATEAAPETPAPDRAHFPT